MAFTPFVDDLGFVVALILSAAAVFTYTGVRAIFVIYRNDPKALRSLLKASAVPVGMIGAVALALGLFVELTWPFLLSDGLGSYDIFFGDVLMMFSMVMIVYAVVAYMGLRLEYAGVFGLIISGIVAWYGYWGYTTLVSPGVLGLTRDPLETFLMYLAFAAAAFFSFPASIAVDWYLEHPGPTWTPFRLALRPAPSESSGASSGSFRLPLNFYLMTAWFPIFAFLAFLAAWFYMGSILPAHLTSPP